MLAVGFNLYSIVSLVYFSMFIAKVLTDVEIHKNIDDVCVTIKFYLSDSPLVTLSLGSTLNPNEIEESDDVYFECNVRANPKEHRITWFHYVSCRERNKCSNHYFLFRESSHLSTRNCIKLV